MAQHVGAGLSFHPWPTVLFWHIGVLQHHAKSLKVVANLHEKEQTAVVLTFNRGEEAQPVEIASSASLALQFDDVSFASWIKTEWRMVGWMGDFISSV